VSTQPIGSVPMSYTLGALQGPSTPAVPAQPPGAGGTTDAAALSQAGQLLGQLETLKQQDPTKFKQLLNQIATQLSTAAQQQSPGAQADLLNQMARRFQHAAQTGDLSALESGGARHHRHAAAQAYGQSQPLNSLAMLGTVSTTGQPLGTNPGTPSLLSNILQQVSSATAKT
jgi:hypothetical protein